jgi:hypothetical protein
MQIVVQTTTEHKVNAYCTSKCGDWFEVEKGTEAHGLKRSVKGKKVSLDYVVEPNRNRVAGPDDD